MIIIGICILVLGPSLITLSEGCGRVPATPAPTVPPTPTQPTINGSVRSVECTPAEKNKTACLNEGTCFVLILNEERVANCHCTSQYQGVRCEELLDVSFPSIPENPTATAGIAASIAVLVIIVIVFTGVAIVYYRKRKRERKQMAQKMRQQNGANGSLLPENHIQPPNPDFHFNGNGNLVMEEKKLMLPGYKTTPV